MPVKKAVCDSVSQSLQCDNNSNFLCSVRLKMI